jgi:hypothetical protein
MAEVASPRARVLVGVALAVLVHGGVLVALRPAAAHPSAFDVTVAQRAAVRAERAALLRTAEADVAAGRATLGETLIRLGWLDRVEEEISVDAAERDRALAAYGSMLVDVRAAVARGEPVERAIVAAVEKDGRAARYKRMYPRLADALARGGGNCLALSTLAVSLAHDAGRGDAASFRVYTNHVAPDVSGFRFGMAKRCHGPGVVVPARDLIAAYARARAKGDREPFTLPAGDDACDDPGDVFGELQIVGVDPAPMPRIGPPSPAGTSTRTGTTEARYPTDPSCRRRTVLEEYEEDVEVLGADGRTLGGVGVPRAATLDLAGHATSAACFERRLEGMDLAVDADAAVLALGDAAMAAEEAARVFAAAGEIDVAREYEHRLAEHRARAAAPLERVIARLGDPQADVAVTLAGAGRLVALGEGGRTAMLLASERHRGFWELANLMTRPSSQIGAIARWRDKPVDVELDVIDALPCASETFLAQLDSVDLPAARTLRAACEVRARVDKEPCALAEALARTRARARAAPPEAGDLCEAVLVRHLAARCRSGTWGPEARQWAATKPAPIARAVASRIAKD